jgi:hypothetical protein
MGDYVSNTVLLGGWRKMMMMDHQYDLILSDMMHEHEARGGDHSRQHIKYQAGQLIKLITGIRD